MPSTPLGGGAACAADDQVTRFASLPPGTTPEYVDAYVTPSVRRHDAKSTRGRPRRDQSDSRRAFAAACRRSLTSDSSRAARSIRSCCISARSCWRSARAWWSSARSATAFSCAAMASTVRVRSANCAATRPMSSSAVTPCQLKTQAGAVTKRAHTSKARDHRERQPIAWFRGARAALLSSSCSRRWSSRGRGCAVATVEDGAALFAAVCERALEGDERAHMLGERERKMVENALCLNGQQPHTLDITRVQHVHGPDPPGDQLAQGAVRRCRCETTREAAGLAARGGLRFDVSALEGLASVDVGVL